MPETSLDDEQYQQAYEQVQKSLDEGYSEKSEEELKSLINEKIKTFRDGDEDGDESDDDEGMITEEEYKLLKNPPKIPPQNLEKPPKKKQKQEKQAKQEEKKKAQDHRQMLIDKALKGVFSIEHPAQSYQRRDFTVSIAIPGSVLSQCNHPKIKTYLCGEIARICSMYRVDEVVIFNEEANRVDSSQFLKNMKPDTVNLMKHVQLEKNAVKQIEEKEDYEKSEKKKQNATSSSWIKENKEFQSKNKQNLDKSEKTKIIRFKDDNLFLANILYFLETPPYLRSLLFPLVEFLNEANSLHPLNTVHHQSASDILRYRDGIITNDKNMVYVGLPKLVAIDEKLEPGTRVTVFIERMFSYYYYGQIVKDKAPKVHEGIYWGYDIRIADSLSSLWTQSPYQGGYDLTIAATERGASIHYPKFKIPRFRHMLIAIGGIGGLERAIENDPVLKNKNVDELFDKHWDVLPSKGVRTLRAEETLGCALGAFNRYIDSNIPPLPQTLPKVPKIPFGH